MQTSANGASAAQGRRGCAWVQARGIGRCELVPFNIPCRSPLPGWSACCVRYALRWAAPPAAPTGRSRVRARGALHILVWQCAAGYGITQVQGESDLGEAALCTHLCECLVKHACSPPIDLPAGEQLRRVAVPRSLSLAWHLGSAVAQAQHAKRDAAEAVAAAGGGRVLFRGDALAGNRCMPATVELAGCASCHYSALALLLQAR